MPEKERFAWRARVREGKIKEYEERHDRLWPEMAELLREAGISNYTIWISGQELFGYSECEKGLAFALEAQAGSPVVERWNEHMKDVLDMQMDSETGAQPGLRRVFLFP